MSAVKMRQVHLYKKSMRILAVMALIATTLIAWPANAMNEAEFCADLVLSQEQTNRDIGRKTDEVTINRGMFGFCGMRMVIFRKEILVPTTSFRAGWEDRRRAQWNQTMCSEPVWAEAIKAGWRMTVEAVFTDGVRFSWQAVCP